MEEICGIDFNLGMQKYARKYCICYASNLQITNRCWLEVYANSIVAYAKNGT